LAIAYVAEAMLESGQSEDAVEQLSRVFLRRVAEGNRVEYDRPFRDFDELCPVFEVLSQMVMLWIDAGATNAALETAQAMYYRTTSVNSSEGYEVYVHSLLAKTLASVHEADLALRAAQRAAGLAHHDYFTWHALGWSAQALAAAGQTDRAVELAERVWVDEMWRAFRPAAHDHEFREDTLGAMVATLTRFPDRARYLIEAALAAANAMHPADSIGRIAGLTMVVDGLFSLGSDEEAIRIYQRIDESLSSLPTELKDGLHREQLLSALNCLAGVLYHAGYKQELCRILGEKRRRCGELEQPYGYLRANSKFVAELDKGTTLWAICSGLVDVETWWAA
jgi:hypothetical protein